MAIRRRAEQPEPQPDPLPDDHAGYRPGYNGANRPGTHGPVNDPDPLDAAPIDDTCHMLLDPATGTQCGRQKRWREGTRPGRGVYLCPGCDLISRTPDEQLHGRSNRPGVRQAIDACSTHPVTGKPHPCKHCDEMRRQT